MKLSFIHEANTKHYIDEHTFSKWLFKTGVMYENIGTIDHQWSPSRPGWMQSTPSHPIPIWSVLISSQLLPRYFEWSFPFRLADKNSTHFSSLPHVPCPSHLPWFDHPNNIWSSFKSYEAPHYTLFSSLLPLPPFLLQIFFSALCSQTPSI